MKKILDFRLFEYKSGPKIKTRWTANDAIITLYYEKFGFRKLGIGEDQIEDFVKWNIGSTETSLKMQASNVRYILSLNRGDQPEGLSNFSKEQVEAVKKYHKLSESELREIVKKILDSITEDEKLANGIRADKEEEKELTKPLIISPIIPLDKYGNPLKTYKEVEKNIEIPLQIGDIVYHKKFGKGVVLDIDKNLIDIKFGSKNKLIIYNYNAFNWNKTESEVEKPKIRQIPTKTPKMLIDTIKPKDIKTKDIKTKDIKPKDTKTKSLSNFKDFLKPELEAPKNLYGKSMAKINNTEKSIPVKIGDILNHKKFGIGEVIDINNDNNVLSIEFISGIKRVLYKPELFI